MAPIATVCGDQKLPTSSSTVSSTSENMSSNGVDIDVNGTGTSSVEIPCSLKAPLVVTIVGLPCRGKSQAAHKIARHLCWKGESAKVINVHDNATDDTLNEIKTFFMDGNNIAIIDGMHLTRQSRQFITNYCNDNVFHHLLVEFNVDDKSLDDNLTDTIEFYKNCDKNIDWRQTFMEKLQQCNSKFESCSPLDGPLIVINNSENPLYHAVTARGVQGALQTAILGVLASPVIKHQVFYFSRHGESEYNVVGRIGGDSDLSARGRKYGERLTRQLTSSGYQKPKLIWTSEFCRTVHTVQNIPGPRAAVKDLNEINAGICEGLTYEEIQERFPQEFAWRDQDKLKYRYPHGESYLDLLQRVDSVVQGLLTKTDVLVVSHQAVLRCVMAYFTGSKPDDVPYINVPLHTLLTVRSYGYSFQIDTLPMNVDCVDTYRVQPQNCSSGRTTADALVTVPVHFDNPLETI